MDYAFLVDTYASERLKTLSVWAMFNDADLDIRPHPNLARDRTFREHMVHQCLSEDKWFTGMFAIDTGTPPVPAEEARLAFIRRYAEDSAKRLASLAEKNAEWWRQDVAFFDAIRSRAWIHGETRRPHGAPSGRADDATEPPRPTGLERIRAGRG